MTMSLVRENELELYTLTPHDLDELLDIERKAYREPWTEGNLRDSIQGGHVCLGWRESGRLRGYAIFLQVDHETHLLNLTIDPEWQGQGWGRKLLKAVMAYARSRGGSLMFLEVRHSNARAMHLYRSAGFRQIGVRRQYYPSAQGREDAVVMEAPL
jgi:ribosomal-protein-alanine N-acetyltransferase